MAKKSEPSQPLIADPQLVAKEMSETAKLIAAIKPSSTQQKLLESDTAKQVLWKVTDDSTLEMTSNITPSERAILLRLAYGYRLSNGNPSVAIRYIGYLKLSKSVSDRSPMSVLEGLFSLMGMTNYEEPTGVRGKLGKFISGR